MNIFIENAWAQADGGGGIASFLPLILIVVLFYFLLIRPQQKRTKQHKAMLAALQKGDEVLTNGGILGKVMEIQDNFITLEIAKAVNVKVQRQAIAQLVPKGSG